MSKPKLNARSQQLVQPFRPEAVLIEVQPGLYVKGYVTTMRLDQDNRFDPIYSGYRDEAVGYARGRTALTITIDAVVDNYDPRPIVDYVKVRDMQQVRELEQKLRREMPGDFAREWEGEWADDGVGDGLSGPREKEKNVRGREIPWTTKYPSQADIDRSQRESDKRMREALKPKLSKAKTLDDQIEAETVRRQTDSLARRRREGIKLTEKAQAELREKEKKEAETKKRREELANREGSVDLKRFFGLETEE